jgi:hypothetical protein
MTRLDDRPVLGQSLGHVSLLRLDRAGGAAAGPGRGEAPG